MQKEENRKIKKGGGFGGLGWEGGPKLKLEGVRVHH